MSTVNKCGKLFTGAEDASRSGQVVRIENGAIAYVGSSAEAPPTTAEDTVLDYSSSFVMPGLIDTHVHLSYGNAKTEEDIDLFAPVEYRALRGLYSAQKVLKAGFTSLAVQPALASSVWRFETPSSQGFSWVPGLPRQGGRLPIGKGCQIGIRPG